MNVNKSVNIAIAARQKIIMLYRGHTRVYQFIQLYIIIIIYIEEVYINYQNFIVSNLTDQQIILY